MATHASLRCICTEGIDARVLDAGISLRAIAEALDVDDLDCAIEAGLLRWNGCIACAMARGLNNADAQQLHAARASRLSALASRERYRARQQRLQQRGARRDARRTANDIAPVQSALPSAAAAALARARTKAAARTKP